MEDVGKEGRTVLFVSHNMKAIEFLCKKVIILNQGKLQAYGDTNLMTKDYLSLNTETLYRLDKIWNRDDMPGNDLIRIHSIKVVPDNDPHKTDITYTSPIKIEIMYKILCQETLFILALHLKTLLGDIVFATASKLTTLKAGMYVTKCFIPCKFLNSCAYSISLYFDRGYGNHLYIIENNHELTFKVYEDIPRDIGIPVQDEYPGAVRPEFKMGNTIVNLNFATK